jgi:hypothetical protein
MMMNSLSQSHIPHASAAALNEHNQALVRESMKFRSKESSLSPADRVLEKGS